MKFSNILCSIVLCLVAQDLFACASCGSGSGDPLILYPNEKFKVYLATRVSNTPDSIRTDGKTAENFLAKTKTYVDFGLGFRITRIWFASLYSGVQTNFGRDETQTDLQELLLKSRLTLVKQDYQKPWLPQVQLLFGYKPKFAKDKFSSQNLELLDVFGNGFHEVHFGYDLWNAQNRIIGGISQTVVFPLEREIDGIPQKPGTMLGSVATLGTYYYGSNKILTGYYLSLRGSRSENQKSIANSSSRSHAAFLTIDYALSLKSAIRATVSTSGLGKSYNTIKGSTYTLSIHRTLI